MMHHEIDLSHQAIFISRFQLSSLGQPFSSIASFLCFFADKGGGHVVAYPLQGPLCCVSRDPVYTTVVRVVSLHCYRLSHLLVPIRPFFIELVLLDVICAPFSVNLRESCA